MEGFVLLLLWLILLALDWHVAVAALAIGVVIWAFAE